MATSDVPVDQTALKRKRKTIRGNITRFSTEINNLKDDYLIEHVEYTCNRLTTVLNEMKTVDNDIHHLCSDEEYANDIKQCESYTDIAELAIFKARKIIQRQLSPTMNNFPALTNDNLATNLKSSITTPVTQSYTVKLPTIKLEPFKGDIEEWQSFWEQFTSSVDSNPNLSVIDKHVFLRGYLHDEPKRLVDGISIVADTYETTKKLLMDKYGDKNRIIQAHLDFLENLTPIRNPSPTSLNEVYIECNRRLQALRALGEDVDAYGRVLTPKILRVFPDDICRRWIIYAKRQEIAEGNITRLIQFLSEEVEGAITTNKIKGSFAPDYPLKSSLENFNVHSKAVSRDKKISPFCPFCEIAGHWPQQCNSVTDIDTRIQKLKATNRCFLCTNRGHTQKSCTRKNKYSCSKCKKKHHVSICKASINGQTAITSTNKIDILSSNYVHLQTARVFITGPTGITKLTRCLLDAGSQSSFVHSDLVDTLKLQAIATRPLELQVFESPVTFSQTRRQVQFELSSIWDKSKVKVIAFESSNKYASHPPPPNYVSRFAKKKQLKLADPDDTLSNLQIEILIGADFYWKVMNSEAPVKLSDSLALVPSNFGWILSGPRSHATVSFSLTVHNINADTSNQKLDDVVRKFWNLESIGIQPIQEKISTHNSELLTNFHQSFEISDGRRVVKLPWKPEIQLSSNNYEVAIQRFNSLRRKLNANTDLKQKYAEHMQDYIDKKQVEVVLDKTHTKERLFYLPHHAVKKVTNEETKWRIVFDASSQSPGHPSLNDVLEVGPNLLPDILATLLRFRLHKIAITSDGRQAFLQLILADEDRDATRFLWYKTTYTPDGKLRIEDEIETYRFTRLPFGLASSPFLLSATLRELATMYKQTYPSATKQIENAYMDDFVMGTSTDTDATILYQEMQQLTSHISLPLAKWTTNSKILQNVWKQENVPFKDITQVLGVKWDTDSDVFQIDVHAKIVQASKEPVTKRLLLKLMSKFYDPLGLFAPVTVVAKILFQDTWLSGIQWDELLPPAVAQQWHKWINELQCLNDICIPRWIGFSANSDVTIHVFCDASERAYGACLYARHTIDVTTGVNLICSRNKLAPVKKVTLPRLELLAALLGARLLQYFCRETKMKSYTTILWSDSTVVLSWIKGDPNRWKTFVCNRTTEILQYTTPAQWRHCPGTDNPADHLTRGTFPFQLSSLESWWHGPKWLKHDPKIWPTKDLSCHTQPFVEVELRKTESQSFYVATTEPIIDISRYSSYTRLLRVTAWILRFVHNCGSQPRITHELNCSEIEKAKDYWIQTVQHQCFPAEIEALKRGYPLPKQSKISCFNPFLTDGYLRLGGRLQFSDIPSDTQHPLLLDGNHSFVHLLIQHTHIRLHHLGVRIVLSELRSTFWILRGRQAIKQVLHKCLPCRLSKAKCGKQIEAPLPSERVVPSAPFTTTGIDFAGPVNIRCLKQRDTAYIALFTCATTRALHIELVSDLTTDKFLLSLQRFVGRRGLPHTIYTDNATTFHAANKELILLWQALSSAKTQQYYAQNGITWKFIAPRAAWWGGWWERLIGIIKQCLRKVLGRSLLDEESLSTVLIGIEAALNSRPLVYEEGKDDSSAALTPAHFLTGRKLTAIPSSPDNDTRLKKIYKQQQDLLDCFWKKWSKEYLLQLRSFHQVQNQDRPLNVRVGDIVLLQEDVRPRHMWKKARVMNLHHGRDGKIRSCELRVNGQKITRPVSLVIPLEVDQGGEDVGNEIK